MQKQPLKVTVTDSEVLIDSTVIGYVGNEGYYDLEGTTVATTELELFQWIAKTLDVKTFCDDADEENHISNLIKAINAKLARRSTKVSKSHSVSDTRHTQSDSASQ